jgi:hypothetical protein
MKALKTEYSAQNFRKTTFSISPRNFAPSQCILLRMRDSSGTCKICIVIISMTFTYRVINNTVYVAVQLFGSKYGKLDFTLHKPNTGVK